MEKPKNYWLRACIAYGSLILAIIDFRFGIIPIYILVAISFFAGILSILQGIRFKDWRYVFLGILSLLALTALIFYGVTLIS